MVNLYRLPIVIALILIHTLGFSQEAESSACVNPVVNYGLPANCTEGTFLVSLAVSSSGSSPFYDIFYSVNGGTPVFWGSMVAGTTIGFGDFSFNSSVNVFVKDPSDPSCEVVLNDLVNTGSSCCTSPEFSTSTVPNCSNGLFQGYFNLSPTTSATYDVSRSVEDGPFQFLGTYASGTHNAGLFFLGQSVTLQCISNDPDFCDETLVITDETVCNETCTDAIPISCGTTKVGHTNGALPESPDPGTCGTTSGSGGAVWYTFTGSNSSFPSAANGLQGDEVTLSLCNDSSITGGSASFDSKIRVFRGSCDSLTCVGGNDDSAGCGQLSSIVTISTIIGEQYYILVHGYLASEGLFSLSMDCEPQGACGRPTDISALMYSGGEVEIQWTPFLDETAWEVQYGFEGFELGTGITVSSSTPSLHLSNLVPDSIYDAYVRAICNNNLGSGPWTLSPTKFYAFDANCFGIPFTDSGKDSSRYGSDEEFSYVLCPENQGDTLAMEFTFVDLETITSSINNGCWDFISIYNGIGFNDTIAAVLCGEESGDGSVPGIPSNLLSVGDRFQSTDPSGCLTVKFESDNIIEEQGWSADITCIPGPCQAPADLEVVEIGFGGSNPRVNAVWNNPENTTDCQVRGGRISPATATTPNPQFSNINNTRIINQTDGSTVNFNIVLYNNPSVPFVQGQTYGYEVRCYCENEEAYSPWSGITPESTFIVPFDLGTIRGDNSKNLSTRMDNKLQVIPNPNNGQSFTIRFENELLELTEAAVIDLNGRVVWKEILNPGANNFSLSPDVPLSEGLYLMRLASVEGVSQTRFMVQ